MLPLLLLMLMPSLAPLAQNSLLGLSLLGWISFSILWVIQVIIACYGMEAVRKYEAFAGPIILVTFVVLGGWVFYSAGGSLRWTPPTPSISRCRGRPA